MTFFFFFFTALVGGLLALFIIGAAFWLLINKSHTPQHKKHTKPIPVPLSNAKFVPAVKAILDEGRPFVTFSVEGNSMRPFLESRRDCVALAKADAIRVGDVVLAEIRPKHYVLHRVIIRDEDDLVLKGDGNVKGIETCTVEHVMAKAVAFYRKGRRRPDQVNHWKWRTYSWFWMRTIWMRRYLLAAYRRIWLRLFPVKIKDFVYDKTPPKL